jgi:uncharacterized protein
VAGKGKNLSGGRKLDLPRFVVDCGKKDATILQRAGMKERYLKMVRGSFRMLRHRKLRGRPWWRALTKPLLDRQLWIPCRDTVASGLAIGLFFSMILVLPLQMLFAAVLAMRFRVNVPFAMAGCWVSNVFTNVPLGLAQVWLGNWMIDVLHFPMPHFLRSVYFNVPEVGQINAAALILGMMVSAVLVALASYPIVHLFSAVMPHHLPVLKRRAPYISKKQGG